MTIGRIVLYRMANGEDRPAIVTRVLSNECVNLFVFADSGDQAHLGGHESNVLMDDANIDGELTPCRWRWPLRP